MAATAGDGDPFFDAVRLLLLLDAAATDVDPQRAGTAPPGAVGVVRTQTFLQKLDFWLRYPDYLADELLTDYEKSGEPFLLEIASNILDSEEPELRVIPMLRYKFGAYEPLDIRAGVKVSVLACRSHVAIRSRFRGAGYRPRRASAWSPVRSQPRSRRAAAWLG